MQGKQPSRIMHRVPQEITIQAESKTREGFSTHLLAVWLQSKEITGLVPPFPDLRSIHQTYRRTLCESAPRTSRMPCRF